MKCTIYTVTYYRTGFCCENVLQVSKLCWLEVHPINHTLTYDKVSRCWDFLWRILYGLHRRSHQSLAKPDIRHDTKRTQLRQNTHVRTESRRCPCIQRSSSFSVSSQFIQTKRFATTSRSSSVSLVTTCKLTRKRFKSLCSLYNGQFDAWYVYATYSSRQTPQLLTL